MSWGRAMTVIRHDWVSARFSAEGAGPEIYAPPERRAQEQIGHADRIAPLRPQTQEAGQADDQAARHLDALIRRVAGSSMDEIDIVIRELESVRELLRREAERVTHEIGDYVHLTRATMTAMLAISGSIRKWKDARD
jgi:hypothetical protein